MSHYLIESTLERIKTQMLSNIEKGRIGKEKALEKLDDLLTALCDNQTITPNRHAYHYLDMKTLADKF